MLTDPQLLIFVVVNVKILNSPWRVLYIWKVFPPSFAKQEAESFCATSHARSAAIDHHETCSVFVVPPFLRPCVHSMLAARRSSSAWPELERQ